MHSTHFIFNYMALNKKEGNGYLTMHSTHLWLYGIRHMVKDHSDSKRENLLPQHGLLFPINSKGSVIYTIPQTGHHIPLLLLYQLWSTGWNEKQLNGSIMKDWSDNPSYHEWTLLPRSYISLITVWSITKPLGFYIVRLTLKSKINKRHMFCCGCGVFYLKEISAYVFSWINI